MKMISQGTTVRIARGSTIGMLRDTLNLGRDKVLAEYNGELFGMGREIPDAGEVRWWSIHSKYGFQAYQRTLVLLLDYAIYRMHNKKLGVEVKHSMGSSLYCEFTDKHVPLKKEMADITREMHQIIQEKVPLTEHVVAKEPELEKLALSVFGKDQQKKINKIKKSMHVYSCGTCYDCFLGALLPDFSYIKEFSLSPYAPGFLLHCHNAKTGTGEKEGEAMYARVFLEAQEWGERIGCKNVWELNHAIEEGKAFRLISIAEALQEKKLAWLADSIAFSRPGIRMVCMAGPSSSGKTTFMNRLIVQLWVNGIKPVTISLDDYYREHPPVSPGNKENYENLDALDVPLFQRVISGLLEGRAMRIPHFNFKTGKREWSAQEVKLEDKQPVLVEGLHALNPELTNFVPGYQCMHIFLSALTQLSIDRHNRISTSDTRLVRRIVRDSWARNNTPDDTLSAWANVQQGERKNIFPFQGRADVVFNTALIYELPVLRTMAIPLLKKVKPESPNYGEARRLIDFLHLFDTIDCSLVPDRSLLREFIGGGKLV